MKKILFIFVFIVVLLNTLKAKELGVFSPSVTCKNTNLGENGQERADTLKNAIRDVLDKFKDDDVSCVPDDLEDIMNQRLKSDKKIKIYCFEEKPKQVRIWDPIKCRHVIKEIKQGGGNVSDTTIFISPSTLDEGVDKTAKTLFHELIHNSENHYSQENGGEKEVTTEDYTYTCTKQCFPEVAEECPGQPVSACKKCNNYKLPDVPSDKKNKGGVLL